LSADAAAAAAAAAGEVTLLRAEVERVTADYAAYRRRTLAMVKERDDTVARLSGDMAGARKQLRAARSALMAAGANATATLEGDGTLILAEASAASAAAVGLAGGGSGGGGGASGSTSGSSTGAAGTMSVRSTDVTPAAPTPHALPTQAQWEYLRNILVRYLGTPEAQGSVRTHLEPAIMMVLGLSPVEVAGIRHSAGRAAPPPPASGAVGSVAPPGFSLLSATAAPAPAAAPPPAAASFWSTATSLLGFGGPAPAE